MIHGHGGNIYEVAEMLGCDVSEITDMSSNLNPLGPPDGLFGHLTEKLASLCALPEVDAAGISKKVAERYGISPENILAGNGTTQLIYTIPLALDIQKALIVSPTYADYKDALLMHDVSYDLHYLKEEEDFRLNPDALVHAAGDNDIVFICNPNNPTGGYIEGDVLEDMAKRLPTTLFVIDESYLPFVKNSREKSMVGRLLPNMLVLNSMSKVFRIPGLRIGFLISHEYIIEKFNDYVMPWSVNSLAQEAVSFLMDKDTDVDNYLKNTERFVAEERERFLKAFQGNPHIQFFPGETYFVIGKLLGNLQAEDVYHRLAREKFLIRNCANFDGLSEKFIRISLKDRSTNMKFSEKLLKILDEAN